MICVNPPIYQQKNYTIWSPTPFDPLKKKRIMEGLIMNPWILDDTPFETWIEG